MNPKKRKFYSLGWGATCPTGWSQVGDTYCFKTNDPTINKDVFEVATPTQPNPTESYWVLKKSILDTYGLSWDMDASVSAYTHVKPPYKFWYVDTSYDYPSVGWPYVGSGFTPEWLGDGYDPCWVNLPAGYQAYAYNGTAYESCPASSAITDWFEWPSTVKSLIDPDNIHGVHNSIDISKKTGSGYAGPIQMKGCSPYPASATAENPLCPGIKPPTPACFAPFDKTSIGLSAMYSLGLSYFFYRDNLESLIPTAALTSAVDNMLRYFSGQLTPIIGSPEYAEYSAPIFSGALGAIAVTSTTNVDSDFKLFLIGAMTNYLTNLTAITVENYQCPKAPSN